MALYEHWRAMTKAERETFAEKCGYSYDYFNIHLIHRRRVPKLENIRAIAEASDGELSFSELCDFFINSKTKTPSVN